jgi:hypothetical protein
MRIYKYVLNHAINVFNIPGLEMHRICHVGRDVYTGSPAVWIAVDELRQDHESQKFILIGTGEEIPTAALKFVGTAICDQHVWHVFYGGKCNG